MSTSIDQGSAILMKPMRPKRSLASLLSIDNNSNLSSSDNDLFETKTSSTNKRRKLTLVDSQWTLKDVPELPFLYLKEKTSVVVLNENPQSIAARIVQCAKSLSAFGQYNGEKAKATLNVDDLEFTVQLFKVTDKSNNCVIVEMQRKNGSSIQFHTIACSILKAAKKQQTTVANPASFKENKRRRLEVRKSPKSTIQNQDEVFACTLEMVDALLKKDRVDANLLGMESLQLLTAPQSASAAMVKYVSNCVIKGDKFHDIKRTITSLIKNCTIDGEDSPQNNHVEEAYYEKMHLCALGVLCNSLKNILDECDLESERIESILSSEEWLDEQHGLLVLLLKKLKNASSNPKEAYLATECLEKVFEKSMTIRRHALSNYHSTQRMLLECEKVGKASYPLLISVSRRLLNMLVDTK